MDSGLKIGPKKFTIENPLWDWPLSDEGFAKCKTTEEKFSVALDFKYLMAKDAEVKKFDSLKTNTFLFTVGLCSVENQDEPQSFWRMEIQILKHMNLILIEAFREVYREKCTVKTLKKLRKVFKLPLEFDITTLNATMSKDQGAVLLEALRKQEIVSKKSG